MNYRILSLWVLLFSSTCLFATNIKKNPHSSFNLYLHNDSIHKLNFKYHDKKRGLKPFIAPAALIASGTTLHFMPEVTKDFSEWIQKNFAYQGDIDDYLQYAPLAAVYSLNLVGIKGKNNFGNRSALAFKSALLNTLLVKSLKNITDTERPDGETDSFPSGHTSLSFAMAHFMHKEYGEQSIWYSISAYATATTVGVIRLAKNSHWVSDVLAGAGIGMLSTELIYLTHLYKWDCEHIKNFDIFPFQVGRQKGLTLVYNF